MIEQMSRKECERCLIILKSGLTEEDVDYRLQEINDQELKAREQQMKSAIGFSRVLLFLLICAAIIAVPVVIFIMRDYVGQISHSGMQLVDWVEFSFLLIIALFVLISFLRGTYESYCGHDISSSKSFPREWAHKLVGIFAVSKDGLGAGLLNDSSDDEDGHTAGVGGI